MKTEQIEIGSNAKLGAENLMYLVCPHGTSTKLADSWKRQVRNVFEKHFQIAINAAADEHDREVGKFQNDVKNLIDDLSGSNVDGGGCDSGDWRDFTLAEIGQGIAFVKDKLDDHKHKAGMMRDKVDNLIAAASLPLPPAIHLEGLVGGLREISKELAQIAEQ